MLAGQQILTTHPRSRRSDDSGKEKNMHVEGFFEGLGQVLGTIIRFVVDLLTGFFSMLGNAGRDFLNGLSRALGMETSLLGMIALVLGLLLLGLSVRAFVHKRVVAGIIWLLISLWLLSLIIH
jgi:hypothetical protein